ncbi:MAG: deoxyribodipyrimidine photo-lyase [Pseudomonadota bacterium]|nr:deoxyribodipyrimidine photo-lyase [Pseudomonadota bacterium]
MSKALFWFRQDLRLSDNPGLYQACKDHDELLCIYIIDTPINELRKKAQSWWLYHSLKNLGQDKIKLIIQVGDAQDVLLNNCLQYQIDTVYWNRCYEPQAIQRDISIKANLKTHGVNVQSFNASCLLEPWEVVNQQGSSFKVFTPYWKQCLKQMPMHDELIIENWPKPIECSSLSLEELELLPTQPNWAATFHEYWQPGEKSAQARLQHFLEEHLHHYKDARNEPALQATSGLSPHLHFGEIGPWQIMRTVMAYQLQHPEYQAQTQHFLSELGWREFSYYLLYHFPRLTTDNFRPAFDGFPWHQDDVALKRWTQGQTGYPIVDAGMRELWKTGSMHNRVRMIVASFLIKDLFIDWREGAKWFDKTLLDADIASNYASWQWVAGSGADAAPYFRIFNPILQGEKFDAQGNYVRKWVPEVASLPNKYIHQPWNAPQELIRTIDYPKPMVDHNKARTQALQYYQALKDL